MKYREALDYVGANCTPLSEQGVWNCGHVGIRWLRDARGTHGHPERWLLFWLLEFGPLPCLLSGPPFLFSILEPRDPPNCVPIRVF